MRRNGHDVEARDHQRLAGLLGIANDLVINIRKVHDMSHLESLVLQVSLEQIAPGKGTEVADMLVIVDSRTTRVDTSVPVLDRLEFFLYA